MSFFDDASLAFLPSGAAGKDGKAYSIKPVPVYGAELVTNGDFATDSNWSKTGGWTISGGTANCAGTGTSILRQTNAVPLNTKFYVSLEVKNYVSGVLEVKFAPTQQNLNVTGNGIYTIYTNGDNNINQDIQILSSNFIGSVDNVSVKEVLVGDGDFTFSRGSNLAATRVGPTGLIEKGRENLLTYSNTFSSWPTLNITSTSGQSGYDGSNDAWLLTDTAISGDHRLYLANSHSGVNTLSVYAKAGTKSIVYVQSYISNSSIAYFDLSAGSVLSTAVDIDSKIEDIGNGWYRCSMAFNNTNTYVTIGIAESATRSYVGDGTGTIYIQDAQLEIGLAASEVIESGATTGKAGLLEDEPRFDYSGGATCPGLLLEPSRTNLVVQSEYFGAWGPIGSPTITTNYGTSPEGIQNSTRLEGVAGDRIYLGISGASATYTYSIYAKGSGIIQLRDNTGSYYLDISLNSEWTRYDYSFTASFTNIQIQLNSATADAEIWGAQLEQGSYPTSYIPNHSGGTITRGADVNTLLNQSGVIGQTAGTILFDAYFDEADKVNFSISDSTSSNYILIDTTSGKQVFARVQQGGSTQATISTSGSFFAEGDRLKCAIAYDDRDMAFYINGTQVGTAAPNLIPACDDVRFSRWNGALAADQRINRVVLFNTRLSNADLETLTT